ncbi:hypothetical protein EIP91_005690 [Steccherinum ochraceum]|uniref:MYND-type domain-containing protein n=1 Tax=Steccherinum ochraceum TaxID=92696 RepID=A0A4R0RF90_9APHY|nr:hypothetical protein EIP91_005690 [Steccherinum ochraceum]
MYYHASPVGRGERGEPEEDARIRSFLLMSGGTLPPFPSLAAVKQDLAKLDKLATESTASASPLTHDPLVLYSKLQNVYLFSILCVTNDVPFAFIREIFVVLKLFMMLLEEDSLKPEMKKAGFYGVPINDTGIYKLRMIARSKVVALSLREDINVPSSARRMVEEMRAEHEMELIRKGSPHVKQPWRDRMPLYAQLADVLVFSNELNNDTKFLLEQLLEYAKDQSAPDFAMTKELRKDVVLSCRIHLSLVLSQLGGKENPVKSKQHTSWVVNQFRDRPHMRDTLSGYVLRKDLPEHPVARALGPAWFANAPSWRSPETRTPWKPSGSGSSSSACAQCGAQKGSSTGEELLRCSRCKNVFYCSKECQKAAWKQHKSACR